MVVGFAHSYLYSFIHSSTIHTFKHHSYIHTLRVIVIVPSVVLVVVVVEIPLQNLSLHYSTVLSLHHFITQPFYKCRISFRPMTGDGRKTMCYMMVQTIKHNKNMIQFNSMFTIHLTNVKHKMIRIP